MGILDYLSSGQDQYPGGADYPSAPADQSAPTPPAPAAIADPGPQKPSVDYSDPAQMQVQQALANHQQISQQVQQATQDPTQNLAQQTMQAANAPQRGGVIMRGIKSFLYGAGQGMMHQAGLPTDLDIRRQQLAEAETNSQIQARQFAQSQQAQMVTLPNGVTMPMALAQKVYPQLVAAQGKAQAAQISSRFKSIPGVGLIDTQQGQVVPGSNPQSVTVTPEIAQQYSIPEQLIGQKVPLQQFSQMERGGAMQWATVQGAAGPALVNKGTGTTKSLGLGNPGVATAAARAGMTPVTVSDGNGGFYTTSALQAINSHLPIFSQVSLDKIMSKGAQASDVQGALDTLREKTKVLDQGAANRAGIAAALADPEHTLSQYAQSGVISGLSPEEQDYVVSVIAAREAVGSMRNLLSAGASSDLQRRLILSTLPGAEAPNSAFANKKIDAAEGILKRISKGIPKINQNAPPSPQNPPGGGGGGGNDPFAQFGGKKR